MSEADAALYQIHFSSVKEDMTGTYSTWGVEDQEVFTEFEEWRQNRDGDYKIFLIERNFQGVTTYVPSM
jgi:hypothetical protein